MPSLCFQNNKNTVPTIWPPKNLLSLCLSGKIDWWYIDHTLLTQNEDIWFVNYKFSIRIWKHKDLQENSRHVVISDQDISVQTHNIFFFFKGGKCHESKTAHWLVWDQELGSPVYQDPIQCFHSFMLYSQKKKNSPSTNVMNISSNQGKRKR